VKRDLSPYLCKIADESVVRLVSSRPVLYPLAVQSYGDIAATHFEADGDRFLESS
jgi:hypothetical protein